MEISFVNLDVDLYVHLYFYGALWVPIGAPLEGLLVTLRPQGPSPSIRNLSSRAPAGFLEATLQVGIVKDESRTTY